jgi:uncharacterized membrane protein YagU involved in acid resistance
MWKHVSSTWGRLEAWINVPVYRRVRRIDVILAVGFVFCVSYYWYVSGWRSAIVGGLMYIMMMMVSLWLL